MSGDYNSRNADKFVVRLRDGLRDEIARVTADKFVSVNSWMLQAIVDRFDEGNRQEQLLDALQSALKKANPEYTPSKRNITPAEKITIPISADKFVIRLVEGMRSEIALQAREQAMSMNSWLIIAFEHKLERDQLREKLLDELVLVPRSEAS